MHGDCHILPIQINVWYYAYIRVLYLGTLHRASLALRFVEVSVRGRNLFALGVGQLDQQGIYHVSVPNKQAQVMVRPGYFRRKLSPSSVDKIVALHDEHPRTGAASGDLSSLNRRKLATDKVRHG